MSEPHILERSQGAQEARCPCCGSSNYDGEDSGIEDDYYFYEQYCNDCGCHWKDWYRLDFTEQEYWTPQEEEEERANHDNYQREIANARNPENQEKALKCLNSIAQLISNQSYNFLKAEIYNTDNSSFYDQYKYFSIYNFVARLRDLVGFDFDMETCRPKPTTQEDDYYIP